MHDLMNHETINTMIGLAPGAIVVAYGGIIGWGHEEHVPTEFGNDVGVVASEPSVVVAAGMFPGIGLDEGEGTADGINEKITVGEYAWTVRAIELGEAPGEIRLMLTNRRTSG